MRERSGRLSLASFVSVILLVPLAMAHDSPTMEDAPFQGVHVGGLREAAFDAALDRAFSAKPEPFAAPLAAGATAVGIGYHAAPGESAGACSAVYAQARFRTAPGQSFQPEDHVVEAREAGPVPHPLGLALVGQGCEARVYERVVLDFGESVGRCGEAVCAVAGASAWLPDATSGQHRDDFRYADLRGVGVLYWWTACWTYWCDHGLGFSGSSGTVALSNERPR